MTVKVPLPDADNEGEFVNTEVPLLSREVRAMIDNMLYVSSYGHKKTFEDRVPQASIAAFRSCALKNSRENENAFYLLWKEYLASSAQKQVGADLLKETAARVKSLMDDDDDDGAGSAVPAAHPAEAAAEGDDVGA